VVASTRSMAYGRLPMAARRGSGMGSRERRLPTRGRPWRSCSILPTAGDVDERHVQLRRVEDLRRRQDFVHLGKFKNDHADGIAVDFSDPQRKTVLVGLHEQEHSLHRSTDQGMTWELIGDKVPPGTAFTTDPIVLDSKTFLINSDWLQEGRNWGIYGSEDAGNTWTQVSTEGASGQFHGHLTGRISGSCLWDQHISPARIRARPGRACKARFVAWSGRSPRTG